MFTFHWRQGEGVVKGEGGGGWGWCTILLLSGYPHDGFSSEVVPFGDKEMVPLEELRRPVFILILVVGISTDITDDNQGVGVRFSLESGGGGGEKRRSS